VAGDNAPSRQFPVAKHLAAGAVLLVLGFVMLFMPDYKTRLVRRAAATKAPKQEKKIQGGC
jgi:hypothetical protein